MIGLLATAPIAAPASTAPTPRHATIAFALPAARAAVPVRLTPDELAAPAPPTTTTTTTTTAPAPAPVPDAWADLAPGWEQRRGKQTLRTVDYPWPQLGYAIGFEPARRGYLALTLPADRTVTVWVRPELSPADLVSILAHEIGHVVDLVSTTPAERSRYLQVRGLPSGAPWDPCDSCEDYRAPAGDWAESFAEWLVGAHRWRSKLGPPPDARQLAELAPLFVP